MENSWAGSHGEEPRFETSFLCREFANCRASGWDLSSGSNNLMGLVRQTQTLGLEKEEVRGYPLSLWVRVPKGCHSNKSESEVGSPS